MDTQLIAQKSLEGENDFSSSSHAINSMGYESVQEEEQSFVIPSAYNQNRVTLLGVNPNTYYVYWELLQATLDSFGLDLHKQQLHFRVQSLQGDCLYTFESPFDLGEYFFTLELEQSDICVKIGFLKENQFIEILTSNVVKTFSTVIKLPDVSNEVWLEKHKNCLKLIQSQFEHSKFNGSSTSHIKQFEELFYMNKVLKNTTNSTSLLGKIL
jgi:hypothetical protein